MRPPARLVITALLYFLCNGCQSPEKQVLQPLPADAPPMPYADLVERARRQVWAAQEVFYRDNWDELVQAADALQQTAERLAQVPTDQLPMRCRSSWPKPADEFRAAAAQLRNHARQRDAVQSANAFQKLHLVLKDIRPD